MFDGEHVPNTTQMLFSQLQAVALYPVHAAARPPPTDTVLIKQYLDIGYVIADAHYRQRGPAAAW